MKASVIVIYVCRGKSYAIPAVSLGTPTATAHHILLVSFGGAHQGNHRATARRSRRPDEDPSTSPLSEPARFEALECLARLHWEGMSSPTLLHTLTFLANLINDYRRVWRPAPDDQIIVNPIYRVSIPSVY